MCAPHCLIDLMSEKNHELDQQHTSITLAREVKELTKEINNLKSQEFMKVFVRPWKFIWFSFLKGLMIGFGEVLGASVLVGIFIYLLSQVKLVPYVGDFVQGVINEIQIHPQLQSTNQQTDQTTTTTTNPSTETTTSTDTRAASPVKAQTTTSKTVTK